MTIDTNKLKKVSTYATTEKVSVAAVYQWERLGKIKVVTIDGVKFVVVK